MMQIGVALICVAVSSDITNKIDESSHQFIVSFSGDETLLENSLDPVNMELTEEDVNKLINGASDKEIASHLSRQAAKVESTESTFIGGPATSASSNLLLHLWVV